MNFDTEDPRGTGALDLVLGLALAIGVTLAVVYGIGEAFAFVNAWLDQAFGPQ